MHPIVERLLSYGEGPSSAVYCCSSTRLSPSCVVEGYGETYGEEHVVSAFQSYLDHHDLDASKLKATNDHINEFLDFLTGQRQPSDDEASGECMQQL